MKYRARPLESRKFLKKTTRKYTRDTQGCFMFHVAFLRPLRPLRSLRLQRALRGVVRSVFVFACLLASGWTHASITLNSLSFPSNIGRGEDVNVDIAWVRTNTAASTFTVPLPANVQVAPPTLPSGCTFAAPVVSCSVAAGAGGSGGTTTFQVRGAVVGGFSLTASSAGSADASNSGNVTSGGDLTVAKTKASPAGNPTVGQSTVFRLTPNLALADDVPAGASIVVTDSLPGTSTDFNLTSVGFTGLTPSCNSVAAANASPLRALICTYSGPFTVAAFNASTILVTGTPGNFGAFTNIGSIATGNTNYFDSNSGNNVSNLNYTVDPGSDLEAQGSFPSTPVLLGSAQTLTLTYRNNGPLNAPAGGTVSTVVPAGFTVGAVPAGCTKTGVGPTTVTCTASAVNNGNVQSFAIPLTMPAAPVGGNFVVSITPPTGFGDAVSANNSVNVPYNVVAPSTDLAASKSKTPGGPQPPGTVVTTTLTVTNSAASASAASYTVAQPLRIVDYLKPEEVSGGTVSAVTANWSCTVTTGVVPPAFVNAAQTTRVACQSTDAGSLAIGASRSVSFSSGLTLGGSTSPISLPNTACTGGSALSALGLAAAAGPQPPDTATGNDCANDSANLVVTPVVAGQPKLACKSCRRWTTPLFSIRLERHRLWRPVPTQSTGAWLSPRQAWRSTPVRQPSPPCGLLIRCQGA